jgi:DNA segregation ATPase FtsK/SpoIIIE, S-DNA-T family
MARKKGRSKLRPKSPARVRKAKRRRSTRGHHHPELIGLGLAVVGLFLGSLLYLGWHGGFVGDPVRHGLAAVAGGAAYLLPVAFVAVGGLLLGRSELLDVRPFRTGLGVLGAGLAVTLGATHDGGFFGRLFGGVLARVLGHGGALLLGIAGLIAATLLLTGASVGSLLRR